MSTELQTEIQIPPTLAERARDLIVCDDETRAAAEDYVRDVKAMVKQVEEFFNPLVDNANKAHKALTTKRAETLKPLKDLEAAAKGKILAYAHAKAAIEQAAAQAERERLKAIADTEERKRRALAAEAEEAARFGAVEVAAEAQEAAQAAELAAFQAQKAAEKIVPGKPSGVRRVWKARVVDIDSVPRKYLIADMETLNWEAKRAGCATCDIPGVRFYPEDTVAVRG